MFIKKVKGYKRMCLADETYQKGEYSDTDKASTLHSADIWTFYHMQKHVYFKETPLNGIKYI